MPYVRRGSYNDRRLVRWADSSRGERVRAVYLRSTAAVAAIVGVVALGPRIVGENPEQLSADEQNTPLRAAAAATYDGMSLEGKFSASFIEPIVVTSKKVYEGGYGLRNNDGFFFKQEDGYKRGHVRVGRSCLQGTAYDTTPSKYDASAVAALSVSGDRVSVHPAGSEADPLTFRFNGDRFTPLTEETRDTLIGYGCRFLGSVPVRTAYAKAGEELDWTVAAPLELQ